MILGGVLHWFCGIITWVLGLVPVADLTGLNAAKSAAIVGLRYAWALNSWFPFDTAIAALVVYLAVYNGAYLLMIVRRAFSLFWPGAGS